MKWLAALLLLVACALPAHAGLSIDCKDASGRFDVAVWWETEGDNLLSIFQFVNQRIGSITQAQDGRMTRLARASTASGISTSQHASLHAVGVSMTTTRHTLAADFDPLALVNSVLGLFCVAVD